MDEESFGQVLDAVRRFVRERVMPREDEIEESDAIPADLRAATAELGLFGYALPAEFGGFGASMAQDVRLRRGRLRRGPRPGGRPSSAKLFCSEMVSRVADRGVQVHGGLGYMSSTVVERMYRDSRLYRLYEGTSEIQKLIIARELLAAAQNR
jgi:alkylation response protein AidB-like acyl-CoA dehydrogenase